VKKFILYYFHALIIVILKTRINTGMFLGKLGTFVALGVRGRGMIENRSFNLVEFCVIMGKTNRKL
jgi:hypothetical protein